MLNEEQVGAVEEPVVEEPLPEDREQIDADERARHDRMVAAVMRMVGESEERNRTHVQEYGVIKRLLRGHPSREDTRGGASEPGKVNANVGGLELFRCNESVTSAMMAVVNGDDPNWEAYDPDLTDQATAGMYHTRQLVDRGHEAMDLPTILTEAARSGNAYGRLMAEVGWEEKKRWMHHDAVMDEMGNEISPAGWSEQVAYARPFMRVLPPWSVYMDPAADRVKNARWVAWKEKLTREDVDNWIAYGDAYGMKTRKLDDTVQTGEQSSSPGETAKTVSDDIARGAGVDPEVGRKSSYNAINYWGLNPEGIDPTDETGQRKDPRFYHIVILDGKEAIIEGVDPYWHGQLPVLDWVQIPEEDTAEGLGTGQLLKSLQILMNETDSLLQEMTMFGLYRVWRRSGALTSGMSKSVRIFPGRIFDDQVDGVIDPIQMDMAPFKLAQQMQAMRVEAMRAASGATTNMQALQSGNTATEVRTIAAEAARRLAGLATSFANQILRPFIEMELALYDQFLPDDAKVVSMVPYNGEMMSAEANKNQLRLRTARVRMKLATDLDFRKNMTRNLNQATAQLTGLLTAIQTAAPAAAPEAVSLILPNIMQLVKKQLAINGINPEVVPKELTEQIAQRMREAQMVAQQQAQLAAIAQAQPQGPAPIEGGPSNVEPVSGVPGVSGVAGV